MLKQIAALSLAASLFALPVMAQNASEIGKVQQGKSCPNCNLFQADLSYRNLPGINVSGARLRQADLSLVTLNGANLSDANLSIANLFGARLSGANLADANLENATLVGAYLGGANLRGAKLHGANLSGAEMALAKGLTQGQLNQACGDNSTQLPRGLTIPPC